MTIKRSLSVLLVMVMTLSLLAGCGNGGDEPEKANSTSEETKETTKETTKEAKEDTPAEEAKPEEVELVIAVDDLTVSLWYEPLEAAFKAEYPHISLTYIETPEYNTKIPISVAAGEPIDVIRARNPIILKQWADANVFTSLNDMAAASGVDFAEYYSESYDTGYSIDGNHYIMPLSKSVWALYYNKAIFDRAGVDYPGEQMTWDEYRETAKLLTQGEGVDKVYGAYSLNWPMYYYAPAVQQLGGGEGFYNAEGMSNIEEPVFAESLERVYNMMHVDNSMPTYAEFTTEKLGWDGFLKGKYGMHIHGSWAISTFFKNPENYPRDWKFGVTSLPVLNEGDENISFGVYSGLGVPASSQHPEEAFLFVKFMSEHFPEFTDGTIPAYSLADMSNLTALIADGLDEDGVTEDDIFNSLTSPKIKVVNEKITGVGATQYDQLYKEEVEMYMVQAQSLEETIENIKKRANKMIEKEK